MMQSTSLGNMYAWGTHSVMQYHHLLQHIICKQFQIIINHMEITGFITNLQGIITDHILAYISENSGRYYWEPRLL